MTEDGLIVRVGQGDSPAADRWTRQRVAIVDAAATLFLRHGYADSTTAQIATAAGVSKQTVYRQFGDKLGLFREIVLGVTVNAEMFVAQIGPLLAAVADRDELRTALLVLAHRRLAVTTDPRVLAARRLIMGEATRFPDLAAEFWRRGPLAVIDALAVAFEELAARGLLTVTDAELAADQFAYLANGRPLDQGTFDVDARPLSTAAADRVAIAAVSTFLAAH